MLVVLFTQRKIGISLEWLYRLRNCSLKLFEFSIHLENLLILTSTK